MEFPENATKIDELLEQAKAMILSAVARTPLMGVDAKEQAKLAKTLKLRR